MAIKRVVAKRARQGDLKFWLCYFASENEVKKAVKDGRLSKLGKGQNAIFREICHVDQGVLKF